jgi:mycothiol synthase
MPTGKSGITVNGPLTPAETAAVLELVGRAAAQDGVMPLSEHVMLQLRYGSEASARNVLLWHNGALAGYGHLDITDQAGGAEGEMVIDPPVRRRGLGLALGRALSDEAGSAGLQLWAHGDLPAAARLATAAGLHRSRALWQMRRSLQEPVGEPQLADGITVRTFRVSQDENAWVALNHRAFSQHPEQGAWTRTDLEMREREPWFDPAGFFLAERDGAIVGFHWTKIHSGTSDSGGASDQRREPIGEVYVVGVDPSAQGTGLGRALTIIGLHYLRDRGLPQVMLYVDETNTAAIRLYESLGFTHWSTDVMFAPDAPGAVATG